MEKKYRGSETKVLEMIDVECSYCGAKVGYPCKWKVNVPPMTFHMSRYVTLQTHKELLKEEK